MSKNESRDDGFYFVKFCDVDEWHIAEWIGGVEWWVAGSDIAYNDSDFDVIGEMVTMPGEKS